ncbi:MAG: UDP-3-O-acyl-N-acetylglucosamine deacetylase [Janthinobacterium lividum]
MSERARVTLAAPSAVLSGVGLHSGADASVRLLPALPGTGLVFHCLPGGQEIPALAANVFDTSRCTRLRANGVEVQTVEHVLSALAGLGIDDAVIEIEGPEVPAMDGSAAPFAELITAAGTQAQDGLVQPLRLSQPVFLSEGAGTIVALPSDRFSATVVLDYPRHEYLGTLAAAFDSAADDYMAQIAPARTFGFLSEIEALRAAGLGLGASFDNAVVLGETQYETPLRFPNELARHKLLDLIGDLALAGRPVFAEIIAIKPGHTLNTRLARLLSEQLF